jgi:small subunit ribosomal protein S9
MAEKSDKKYIEAVGRRKTAVARVRLTPASKASFEINGKNLADFFSLEELVGVVQAPFNELEQENKYTITVKVLGGGIRSQAEAIRLGISRALIKDDSEKRKTLKKAGFLKRDPRRKERKKPGLRKARKRPQWSKR